MKKRSLILLIVVIISMFLSSCGVIDATGMNRVEESSDKTVDASNVKSVDVLSSVGSININTWDREDIYVKITKKNAGYKSREELMKELEDAEVVVKEENGKLDVKAYLPKFNNNGMSVVLDISVPKELQEYSVKSEVGDVEIKDISGRLDVVNNVGKIQVEDSSGKMNIKATTGDVNLKNCMLKADSNLTSNVGKVSFEGSIDSQGKYKITNNVGKINVTLPADAAFEIDSSTNVGSIDCGFNVEGKVDKEEVRGKVNGGGPQITIVNNTGSIDINKK